MSEDSNREHERIAEEARHAADEAVRASEEAAQRTKVDVDHLKEDMETGEGRDETLRQMGLIYSGLIGVAILMVQPFLGAASLDVAATISVIAFAVAVPLLATLVLLNRQESYRQRRTPSVTVLVAQLPRAGRGRRGARRRLLAHRLGRRRVLPRRRLRGAGRALGRLHPPGAPPQADGIVAVSFEGQSVT